MNIFYKHSNYANNLRKYCDIRFLKLISLITISITLHACSHAEKQSVSTDYFPIKEGRVMEYSVKKTTKRFAPVNITHDYTIKTLPSRTLNGHTVTPMEYYNGHLFFLLRNAAGVFYVGKHVRGEKEARLENTPKLMYKLPLKPGTVFRETWQPSLTTNEIDINMKYTVLPDLEDITVPAGSFKKCIHIKGTGSASLPAGHAGFPDQEVLTMEVNDWLCPGTGYVKEVLEESGTFTADGLPEDVRQVTVLKSFK